MQPYRNASHKPARHHWILEAEVVFLGGWIRLWSRLWIILAAIAIGAALVLVFSPQDNALLAHIRSTDAPQTDQVAKFFSQWGDLNFSVPIAILLWIIGAATQQRRWRKLGIALLMASLVSGLILNIFRIGCGRPRPYYQADHPEIADGFYGPKPWKGYMQSFPSGHACASSTTASVLGSVSPILAVPSAAYTLAVSWSRMQLNRHHPIDVTIGTVVGTVTGLCYASTVPGTWIRLRRRHKSSAPKKL